MFLYLAKGNNVFARIEQTKRNQKNRFQRCSKKKGNLAKNALNHK